MVGILTRRRAVDFVDAARSEHLAQDETAKLIEDFLRNSRRSLATVARAVDALSVEPNGREVTKSRVNSFKGGITPPPDWFVTALDELYPDWREIAVNRSGRQKSTGSTNLDATPFGGEAAWIPPIGSGDRGDALKSVSEGSWRGRTIPVPPFLRSEWPLQPIDHDAEERSPFDVGDFVQLRFGVTPLRGRLYAVTHKETREGHYAACLVAGGRSVWVLHDGTVLKLSECETDAAVVAYLPQYEPGKEKATINSLGLEVPSQIPWPTEVVA